MQARLIISKLLIEDIEEKVNSKHSLRWVEVEGKDAYPVLYKNGKRVVKKWSLQLSFDCPEDEFGNNANTSD